MKLKPPLKKHGLELFAIHADVGGLPGEDKVKSLITLFEIAYKLGIPIITMRAKGKSDDEEATERGISIPQENER